MATAASTRSVIAQLRRFRADRPLLCEVAFAGRSAAANNAGGVPDPRCPWQQHPTSFGCTFHGVSEMRISTRGPAKRRICPHSWRTCQEPVLGSGTRSYWGALAPTSWKILFGSERLRAGKRPIVSHYARSLCRQTGPLTEFGVSPDESRLHDKLRK